MYAPPRGQREINDEIRILVRSATTCCKFSTTKNFIDETSTVQGNKILELEVSFFYCASALFSLIKTLMFHCKSLLMSIYWTLLHEDQEMAPIMYTTSITRRFFILVNAFYSSNMLVVETRDQQIPDSYDILTIIGTKFYLYS